MARQAHFPSGVTAANVLPACSAFRGLRSCEVILDANIYLSEKKIFEMNARGAPAAASVRVLERYLGLKYIQGGTQGSCSRAGGMGGGGGQINV